MLLGMKTPQQIYDQADGPHGLDTGHKVEKDKDGIDRVYRDHDIFERKSANANDGTPGPWKELRPLKGNLKTENNELD